VCEEDIQLRVHVRGAASKNNAVREIQSDLYCCAETQGYYMNVARLFVKKALKSDQ
jgi:hypothetical protein